MISTRSFHMLMFKSFPTHWVSSFESRFIIASYLYLEINTRNNFLQIRSSSSWHSHKMTPSEDPPSKVSSILLSYDRVRHNIHPVVIDYYAKSIQRSVTFTVKVPSTNEELKQELRTSMKSGRKYDYQSKRLGVALTDDDESSRV